MKKGKLSYALAVARRVATPLLLALSLVLIATGIYLGEPSEVLRKAINICLECIGVG